MSRVWQGKVPRTTENLSGIILLLTLRPAKRTEALVLRSNLAFCLVTPLQRKSTEKYRNSPLTYRVYPAEHKSCKSMQLQHGGHARTGPYSNPWGVLGRSLTHAIGLHLEPLES
eukprot:6143214-Amphidinium_carterae.1